MKQLLTVLYLFFSANAVLGKKCTNTAPFLEHMVYGYDLSEFDLFGCPEIGGKRAAIINISDCSYGRNFEMKDEHKTKYEIPDAFKSTNETERKDEQGSTLVRHFESFYDSFIKGRILIHPSSVDYETYTYLLKSSKYYKEMRKMFIDNGAVEVIRNHYTTLTAKLEAIEDAGQYGKFVLQSFKNDVDALPATLTGNEAKYKDFIRKYGTHYITFGGFGGLIQGVKAIKSNDAAVQNKTFDEDHLHGVVLSDSVDILCKNVDDSRKVYRIFDRKRNYTQVMTGFSNHREFSGKILPISDVWKHPAPWLTVTRYISDLLFGFEGKKVNLQNAIRLHMAQAGNKAFAEIISEYKDKQITTTKSIQALNKYNTLKNGINLDDLRSLNEELDKALDDVSKSLKNNNN